MSNRAAIHTVEAPQAIGPYSQAVKVNNVVYLSGQIPLDPATMELVGGDVRAQAEQVLCNLQAVARAAGGDLEQLVKLTVFLTDLGDFAVVNEVMSARLAQPYPARSTFQVAALPRGAAIEIEAIMVLRG